ncbi:DUF72 domain-containing protein [Sphingosinicella sp. YJ22]|uniref:DUF72 domain-containing protein n=1 Tax=Sphingosinicella sp. YJ22 TaxID=1104780 RepID=UPI0014093326|nr:DUF72 domain-containing protein [Sphingosinicella sp. YJ22]
MAIHIGIGGWDYDPWRGTFYPQGLARTKQLHFASRQLSAIEINATFYKLQRPELFAGWRDTVPDGFKFAIKGSRFCTNRKVLAEAGESVERFCAQGLTELGDKLGPILWQLAATKPFDADDIAGFLKLLPREQDGVRLRHVIEARHESFGDPRFAALAREAGVAICYAEGEGKPTFPEQTADFTYARLMSATEEEPLGYPAAELDRIADLARTWSDGGKRDVFVFFIAAAKVRNPAAAQALIERLGR